MAPLPDDESAARSRQAALQAELLRALTGCSDLPPGFDADRLQIAATSLAAKRARGVAQAWPGLARALGPGFGPAFAEYARSAYFPTQGGPYADGRAFARALASRGRLPEAGRIEALAADLRFATQCDGLVARRWPRIVAARLRHPARLILAARWPGLGEWWLTLPLRHSRDLM